MRHTIALAALLALIAVSSARAEEWCGFIDKENAPVHCGYSSLEQCKQSLGDKKGAKAAFSKAAQLAGSGPLAEQAKAAAAKL